MSPEPLLQWSDVLSELIEFVAALIVVGAVGFRFVVLPGATSRGALPAADEQKALASAAWTAAAMGLVGAIVGLWHLSQALPAFAARRHVEVGELIRSTPPVLVWVIGAVAAAAGFLAAVLRVPFGWWLAALGVIAGALRNLASGQIERLAKPVHVLAAGLWVGTLFVLLVAGVLVVLRARLPSPRRGALVAGMIHAFSPLALASAGVLAVLGAYLSWRELGGPAALATPYGRALLVKLALVAGVLALGAWNWRGLKPKLGSEAAARTLVTTAGAELAVAFLVLIATAVLVSLPAPR